MNRRIWIGGAVLAVALVLVFLRLANNSGAKSGLDAALSHLPPGFTATHGAVTYSALSGEARVRDLAVFHDGALVFAAGDVSVSGIGAQDAAGTPRRIGEAILHDAAAGPYKHIARIDLTGLYPATLREIFDAAAYPGGKPAWTDKRLVLEHGEIQGAEGEQAGVKTRTGAPVTVKFGFGVITMEGLRLSQLAAPPDLAAPPAVLGAEIEAAMSQESGTIRDVTFAVDGPSPVRGGIGRSNSVKFDGGRLAEFSAETITLHTDKPAGDVTVARLGGRGLDVSGLLTMLPAIAAEPNKPHPEILRGMHLESGEMHGLRVDYPSGPLVTIDSMTGRAAPAHAPDTGTFAIAALAIKTSGRPMSPAARAQLDSFGMADFITDLDEEGGYDTASGQLTVKRFDVVFHDLGTLHMTANIAGLPSTPAKTPADMQRAVAAARLTDASLTWDDHSLTSRLLKMTAARQGVTPDQLRMSLAVPLATLAVLMPDQPDAVAQVNAFLSGQHRLAATAKPAVPVGIAQWQATPVPQRAALLGLRVSGS